VSQAQCLNSVTSLLSEDLDHVLAHTLGLWGELRGGRLFLTGGTGFFGTWLLESFAWANDALHLGAQAVVLSRDSDAFCRKAPHLADHPAVSFHRGDVRDFEFPSGAFSHVIHAATQSGTSASCESPLVMIDTIIEGTRRTLEFTRHCGARKFLLTSSGAVYGRQPPGMSHIPEDYAGAPDPMGPGSDYGHAKRLAEHLCFQYAQRYGIEAKIARGFNFVGPHLPLDAHFAIGNFIGDALAGRPIVVRGDGTPYRSYLYAADLAVWLWTILYRGASCRPYNVGSEEAISIGDLARRIAAVLRRSTAVRFGESPVSGKRAESYVPQTRRARSELGLGQRIPLHEAVERTARWHVERGNNGVQRSPF
jgi:nucleoside-diphosphate-sugar epimerase